MRFLSSASVSRSEIGGERGFDLVEVRHRCHLPRSPRPRLEHRKHAEAQHVAIERIGRQPDGALPRAIGKRRSHSGASAFACIGRWVRRFGLFGKRIELVEERLGAGLRLGRLHHEMA
jgi:hypothetical protein